ncbi:reverse transcriptase domain-containing protein [Priestia aryabhattai]|uniref:reverse transcriptase domain-containing protein n=1 Tax=Priestia aryabhattai TaxID=412384 RepID=UPI0030C9458C
MSIKIIDIDKRNLYKSLAIKLDEVFVMNKRHYAEQLQDGNYNTKNNIIDPLRIHDMLVNKKSYLTYQQVKTKLKWICLDFDIDKTLLEKDFVDNPKRYIDVLIYEVKRVCDFLDSYKIKYLTEFSGNRGIHIWIIFNDTVEKSHAYQLVEKILDERKGSSNADINIDLFPKNGNNNKNRVGFGVKLPLSFHTKSKRYSYLIDDIFSFEYSPDIWKKELDEEFLKGQLEILSNYHFQSFNEIVDKIKIELVEEDKQLINPFIQTKNVLKETSESLDSILNKLKNCKVIDEVLKKYPNNLNESERTIFVGLLNRLKTTENDNYGKELLWEFFSNMNNFKPELTRKKLEHLNLLPPTCQLLKSKFPLKNSCQCGDSCPISNQTSRDLKMSSPLKFLEDIDLIPYDAFEVKQSEVNKVIKAQKKYTSQNDEISFLFTQLNLENTNSKYAQEKIINVLSGNYEIPDIYKFLRLEKNNKERTLFGLQAEEKLVTTYLIKILNAFYYTEFSDNSYGYKFESSFANYNIFKPWMQQWLIYRNRIMERLNDNLLKDHYVIKLDIKKFYSNINLGRLKTKLIHGPSKVIKEKLSLLSSKQLEQYNNLVDYLIDICEKYSEEGKGVLQGPAFSRYLAEVYLIELDKYIESIIESKFNFYFRYVDDIILILETKEQAQYILGKVKDYLESLDLKINWDKYSLSVVKESRGDFENYFNENKYFVDTASKKPEINSSFINKKSTNLLSKMVRPTMGTVNEENLSFYFTHFNKNKRLLEEKKKLEPYLFNLEIGRGSLFRNYFRFYFSSNNQFDNLVESSKLLKGLTKGVFLNTLFEAVYCGVYTEKQKIKCIIDEMLKTDLNDYELELILSIGFFDNEYINNDFIKKVDSSTLLKILGFKFEKIIPEIIESKILDALEKERDLKKFIINTYNIVFYNTLSSKFIVKLSKMFFNKIIQSMGTTEPKEFSCYFLDCRSIVNQYYHLCCLLTFSEENFLNIKRVWENLITYVNMNFREIEIDYNKWLKRTSIMNFESLAKRNLNTILTIRIHDNFVDGNGDVDNLKLYDHFHTGIVLFLMEVKDEKESITDYLNQEGIDIIKQIQQKYNLEFISWIIDETNVQMYPDKKIGQRNVIENDRIVLRRGNKLLVRISKKEVLDLEFDYLKEVQVKAEEWLDGEYISIIFEYNREDYASITQMLSREKNFYCYINKIIEIFDGINMFKDKFIQAKELFPNIIGDLDLIHKETLFPLIPFSNYDNKLVLSENISIDNNAKSFYKAFFNRAYSEIELFRGKPYVIKTKELNTNFFPKKIQDDAELKIIYLKHFIKVINKDKIENPFYFEMCKFKTIMSFIDAAPSQIEDDSRKFYSYLEHYHFLYKGDADLLKLLFSPQSIRDASLLEVLYTIRDSMINAIKSIDGYNFIEDVFEKEMSFLEHIISQNISIPGSDKENYTILDSFKRCSIEYDDTLNEIVFKDFNQTVSEEEWENVKVYHPQQKDSLVKTLETSDISMLENSEHCYVYKTTESYMIVILPDIISKTLDTIRIREKLYKKYQQETNLIKLDCFENSAEIEREILYSPYFEKAVEIIKEQSFYMDRELKHIEADLVTWIRRFDSKYHKSLLNVIASHSYIKEEDVESFFFEIKELLKEENNIFFHIKSAEDHNGFHRIILSGFKHTRNLELDKFIGKVLEGIKSEHQLVILAEIGISGSQICNALKWYYLSNDLTEKSKLKLIENEKYYDIPLDKHDDFKKNMRSFRKVHIVFTNYTEKCSSKIISEISSLLNIQAENITFFPQENNIFFEKSILTSHPNIESKHKKLFEELIRDVDYIAKLFKFDETQKEQYHKYLKDLDKTRKRYNSDYNLILRKGSLPKKSHPIFTLESSDFSPLFEKTKEHKE